MVYAVQQAYGTPRDVNQIRGTPLKAGKVQTAQPPKVPPEVRCTNCNDSTGLVVAGLAALVAVVSLIVSIFQTRLAARQTKTTERELELIEADRAALQAEARRRARVELEVRLHPAGAYLLPDAGAVVQRSDERTVTELEIRIENCGERAARDAVVNVIAPDWLEDLRWIYANGAPVLDSDPPQPAPEPQYLVDREGNSHDCQYLETTEHLYYQTILQRFIAFDTPRAVEPRAGIPFSLTVSTEDLEDGFAEFLFHLGVGPKVAQ